MQRVWQPTTQLITTLDRHVRAVYTRAENKA